MTIREYSDRAELEHQVPVSNVSPPPLEGTERLDASETRVLANGSKQVR